MHHHQRNSWNLIWVFSLLLWTLDITTQSCQKKDTNENNNAYIGKHFITRAWWETSSTSSLFASGLLDLRSLDFDLDLILSSALASAEGRFLSWRHNFKKYLKIFWKSLMIKLFFLRRISLLGWFTMRRDDEKTEKDLHKNAWLSKTWSLFSGLLLLGSFCWQQLLLRSFVVNSKLITCLISGLIFSIFCYTTFILSYFKKTWYYLLLMELH